MNFEMIQQFAICLEFLCPGHSRRAACARCFAFRGGKSRKDIRGGGEESARFFSRKHHDDIIESALCKGFLLVLSNFIGNFCYQAVNVYSQSLFYLKLREVAVFGYLPH